MSNLRLASRAVRGEPVFPYLSALRAAESVGQKSESLILVPGAGLEPARPCGQQILSLPCIPFHHPGFLYGAPGGSRTPDLFLRRELLYPLSYRCKQLNFQFSPVPLRRELLLDRCYSAKALWLYPRFSRRRRDGSYPLSYH